MSRFAFALTSLFALAACTYGPDSSGCDLCPDGGPHVDAFTPAPDASTDAGPQRSCPPGPVAPDTFDCAASDPSITFGDAITADAMTWTFIDFPDAFCMDGSTTGIGVNLNPASSRVLIYLEGGGACFDDLSCAGVANPNGFDASDFTNYLPVLDRGLFDRTDANNPMKDASFIYIPYCTGDVHGGTNPDGDGRMYVGYRNVTAYLKRLVPTFRSETFTSGVDLVMLTGRSAGGLGTLVNYEQVQEAFDCTPVHVFDDAGTLLGDDYLKPCLQSQVRELWGLDAIIPSDCEQCTCSDGGGLWNVYPYLARRHPDRRFGLVTSMEDATFRQFFGYGYSRQCNLPLGMPADDYTAGLNELRERMADDDNFHTFYVPGDEHTFSYMALSATSAGGVTLEDWYTQLVEGDAAWTDVGP